MILCTVGTNGAPFDRLLAAVAKLDLGEELVIQHGPSSIRPAHATCFEFLPFARLVELVCESRAVVTHAGVGSILVALTNGRRPVVMPRLARHGEAIDDHQLDLGRRLDRTGLARLVEEPSALAKVLSGEQRTELPVPEQSALVRDLAGYLAHGAFETSLSPERDAATAPE